MVNNKFEMFMICEHEIVIITILTPKSERVAMIIANERWYWGWEWFSIHQKIRVTESQGNGTKWSSKTIQIWSWYQRRGHPNIIEK